MTRSPSDIWRGFFRLVFLTGSKPVLRHVVSFEKNGDTNAFTGKL